MPHGDPRHAALIERGLPVVMVDESPGETDAFVGIDDRGGARTVAQHMIDLGHRRFAVIVDRLLDDNYAGPADLDRQAAATFDVNIHRLRGYADAMEPVGIEWGDVPVIECHPLSPEAGAEAAAYLLDQPDRPTAILCGADQLALGVLDAARDRGIRVPDDLSVAGFDDIDEASRSSPPLTTIRQPLLEKGRAAAHQLFADWSAGPPEPIILPVELIVRQSTGPAPS
jgi:DNA-binding LacI/PurR family transcriptional regulator